LLLPHLAKRQSEWSFQFQRSRTPRLTFDRHKTLQQQGVHLWKKKYKNKDYKKWKIKVSGAGADTLLCGEGWHQHQPFRHCQTKAGGVVQVLCG